MTVIGHIEAAERLFAATAGELPADAIAAARLIAKQYRLHPDPADAIEAMADAYGDRPGWAAARMRACLELAPMRVEVPDDLGLLGCAQDALGACAHGPLTLVDRLLYCPAHVAGALLAETAGGDDDEH